MTFFGVGRTAVRLEPGEQVGPIAVSSTISSSASGSALVVADRLAVNVPSALWCVDRRPLIADNPDVYLTTPHFDGVPTVLVRLEGIPVDELAELIEDAWRLRAPKRLLTLFDSRRTS